MQRKQRQTKDRQLLLDSTLNSKKEFGGALLKKSHAKKARPISTKQAMHVTLRSSQARGEKSFLANRKRAAEINSKVHSLAKKYGIKIYRYANVGNHIHLLVRASYRRGFIAFLRSISGIIARIAMGVERGKVLDTKEQALSQSKAIKMSQNQSKESVMGFWDQRPWTRILSWATDFNNVKKYVEQNFSEAMGFIAYKPRKYLSTA